LKHLVLALLLALSLPVLASGTAAAASPATTPSSAEAHPVSMQSAAADVARAKLGPLQPFTAPASQPAVGGPGGNLQREVFGFALESSLTDPTLGYPSWNFSLLSTVAVFGLHVGDNGMFAADSGWSVWNSSQLTGLINAAHSAGTKVVATIILQDFASGTPHMCAGLANRAATVAQTVSEVKAKGVDGVNVDFEGLEVTCANGVDSRAAMTDLIKQLRAALPGGSYLSVDTYASSAADPIGFFDIPGISANADSFFVMAYDSEYSNYGYPPTNCTSFCLGPTAPLTGYHYNDTVDMTQYTAVVPASKVILGVPYYGRKSCVASATPNQYPVPGSPVTADGYLDANGEYSAAATQGGSYAPHRDANDPSGQERWDTWFNTQMNCRRELYWDDVTSLQAKYDLVNRDNLRGVGLWNLNFGGGAPELWNSLAAKFATTTPWYSSGGALTSGADVASWGRGRADAFARGLDNGLTHSWWDGTSWSGPESLGGSLTADPSAASWGANRIDVFGRGSNNELLHKWWGGSGWSGWETLGGGLSGGPDAASWGTERLDLFARGSDMALWHMWWDGHGWSNFENLGGYLTSDPTAVSWAPNRIDVFARGTDYSLVHKWWDGSRWSGWESLGGYLTSSPDASSCSPGQLDIFSTGSDQAMYQIGFDHKWLPYSRLGGKWYNDPGAVCPAGANSVILVDRGRDGALWHTAVPPF
jgi:spore germination protein YaaH